MSGSANTLKEPRPFESPEAAARELLRIIKTRLRDDPPRSYTGVVNSDFTSKSGGSIAEYSAGRDYGIAQGWFKIHESGTRIFVLPAGDEQA